MTSNIVTQRKKRQRRLTDVDEIVLSLHAKATTDSTVNAIHRKNSVMWCGMTRTHFTSHNQRDKCGSMRASTCTGYTVVAVMMVRLPSATAVVGYGHGVGSSPNR